MIVNWWYVQLAAVWHWYLPLCVYVMFFVVVVVFCFVSVSSFLFYFIYSGIKKLDGTVYGTSMS